VTCGSCGSCFPQGSSRQHMVISTCEDWESCGFAAEKPLECSVKVDTSIAAKSVRLSLEKTVNDTIHCEPNSMRAGFLKPFREDEVEVKQQPPQPSPMYDKQQSSAGFL
jgi:hypothetical protein